jgi:GDPmannose 4,6-dehydratase
MVAQIDPSVLAEKTGISEPSINAGQVVVEVDAGYYRPTEVDALIGDFTKAREAFGWAPKTKFHELVTIMMDAEIHSFRNPQTNY